MFLEGIPWQDQIWLKLYVKKNNISLSELARKIGQTPQNFNKKLLRNMVSDDELIEIFSALNVVYEQRIRFADGTSIETKLDQNSI
jgi:predicted nucleotidyltransferase